mgnify:CR=1 FL=1|jgi:hypothetical protein
MAVLRSIVEKSNLEWLVFYAIIRIIFENKINWQEKLWQIIRIR